MFYDVIKHRGGALFLALDIGNDRALSIGSHDVDINRILLAKTPAAPDCLVLLLVTVTQPTNTMLWQCCQFIPNPAMVGLVTRTRYRPSENPVMASILCSSL